MGCSLLFSISDAQNLHPEPYSSSFFYGGGRVLSISRNSLKQEVLYSHVRFLNSLLMAQMCCLCLHGMYDGTPVHSSEFRKKIARSTTFELTYLCLPNFKRLIDFQVLQHNFAELSLHLCNVLPFSLSGSVGESEAFKPSTVALARYPLNS